MATLRLRKSVITGAAALALVAGGTAAGAAVVSAPVDAAGVIHGCWTNAEVSGSHVFLLQDAGASCPKGTTAISWNQQGPAGPQGVAGATGPRGAAGANGSDGQSVTSATLPVGDVHCATGGTSLTSESGTTYICNGNQGPQGQPGLAGAGLTSLESLSGTPCDTGTDGAGFLSISYTANNQNATDAVNITCDQDNPNQQFALNVTIQDDTSPQWCTPDPWPSTGETCTGGGTGSETITDNGGNNWSAAGVHTASYANGTVVTLTATMNGASDGTATSFEGWTGCDSVSADGLSCIVTMDKVHSVTATDEG